jgi:hypothetical protein
VGTTRIEGEALLLNGLAVAAAAVFLFQNLAFAVQVSSDGQSSQPTA